MRIKQLLDIQTICRLIISELVKSKDFYDKITNLDIVNEPLNIYIGYIDGSDSMLKKSIEEYNDKIVKPLVGCFVKKLQLSDTNKVTVYRLPVVPKNFKVDKDTIVSNSCVEQLGNISGRVVQYKNGDLVFDIGITKNKG